MPVHRRLLIAIVIGLVSGMLTFTNLRLSHQEAGDFSWMVCIAVLAVSLIVLPNWPLDWLNNVRTGNGGMHRPTIFRLPFGPLLILALFKWREERARLLLVLSIIRLFPVFYDHVPAFLVVRSWREGIFLAVVSWVGFFLWHFVPGDYAWTSMVFIGALLVVFSADIHSFSRRIFSQLAARRGLAQ